MSLTKRLTGYRFVVIEYDDTLQAIALRELGDANRWRDLIAINDLVPPYLTGDVNLAGPKVRLYGQELTIPAVTIQTSAASDPERVFGVDLLLNQGLLVAENGDLALVKGVANLKQAIRHRIATALRELLFHPNYGCGVHLVKGDGADPTTATLGAKYVEGALLQDPRISSVPNCVATITGDACAIQVTAEAISGTSVDILQAV